MEHLRPDARGLPARPLPSDHRRLAAPTGGDGVGVAAALSNMLGLSPEATRHAIAITATGNVPMRASRAGMLSIGDALGVACPPLGDRALELGLDLGQHVGVEHGFDPSVAGRALSGDSDCVAANGSVPGLPVSVMGPVARYVWDLGGFASSAWVVPLGASGDPASPHHHDQLPLWAAARLAPVVTDWIHSRK